MKKGLRKALQVILISIAILSFSISVACGTKEAEPEVVATHSYVISVNNEVIVDFSRVAVGAEYELTNSDSSVISVEKSGRIKALKIGTSTISQTFGGNIVEYKFTVVAQEREPVQEEVLPDKDINVAVSTLNMAVSGFTSVKVSLRNVKATEITWGADDNTVVSVVPASDNLSCMVSALKVGEAKIWVSDGIIKEFVNVTVIEPDGRLDSNKNVDITIAPISATITVNGSVAFDVETELNVAEIVWAIENDDVASIVVSEDNKGCAITGLSIGETKLTATIGDKFAEAIIVVRADTLTELATPNLTINQNVLTWTAVQNASGYQYSLDGGVKWEDVDANTLTKEIPENYKSGKYSVKVRAKGDGLYFKTGASSSGELITSLFTTYNINTREITWKLQDGITDYNLNADGTNINFLDSGDYTVSNGYATFTINQSISKNADLYISSASKNGNHVSNLSNDLGLVVLFTGVGLTNPNPIFQYNGTISSVKIGDVQVKFIVDANNKVYLEDYTSVEIGTKLPMTIVADGKTINSNIAIVDTVLTKPGDTKVVSSDAEYYDNPHVYFYALNKFNQDYTGGVANEDEYLVCNVGGYDFTFDASSLKTLGYEDRIVKYVKASDDRVEKIILGKTDLLINNKTELEKYPLVFEPRLGTITEEDKKISGFGGIVALNANIDASDLKMVYARNPYYNNYNDLNGWGMRSQFNGNGYTIYNMNSSLFVIVSRYAKIVNLSISGDISSSSLIAQQFYGTLDNCYFDINVMSTNSVLSLISSYMLNSNVKNTIIRLNNQTSYEVYAAGKNADGAVFTNSYIFTNKTNVDYKETGSVAKGPIVRNLADGMTAQEKQAFIANGANPALFDMSTDVPKFEYTRPEEVSFNCDYSLFTLNASKNGRVANTEGLTITHEGQNYTISAQELQDVKAGTIVTKEVVKTDELIVKVNVRVVTAIIDTAEKLSKMFYYSDYRLFGSGLEYAPSNVHQFGMGNYFVLTKDIDMAGVSMTHSKNGYYESEDLRDWGFQGTIDGDGHVITNFSGSLLIYLARWGTVKNLGIVTIDGSNSVAGQISGTVDNVYINNTIVGAANSILATYLGATAQIKNTVIVVNNTSNATEFNAIAKKGEGATFTNSYVYTNATTKFGENCVLAAEPTISALNGTYTGTTKGFNEAFWDFSGTQPAWVRAKVTIGDSEEVLYSLYKLNDTKDGRVENTSDLSITVNGKTFNIPAATLKALGNGGASAILVKEGYDYIVANVKVASVVLYNAEDLANWVRIAGGGGSHWGHGLVITLGADIDATGVSIYYHQDPGYHEEQWGFTGTFDGNGHTISNLSSGLIGALRDTTIKNLKLVNCKTSQPFGGYMSGLNLENCEVEIDATNLAEVRLFAAGIARTSKITNCKFTVKNASATTKIMFGSKMRASGTLAVTNVSVTTNAGIFTAIGDQTSAYDFTGASTKTIASASFAPIAE